MNWTKRKFQLDGLELLARTKGETIGGKELRKTIASIILKDEFPSA